MRENNELGYYGIAQELYKEAGPLWDAVKAKGKSIGTSVKGGYTKSKDYIKNSPKLKKGLIGGGIVGAGAAEGARLATCPAARFRRCRTQGKAARPAWL